MKKCWKSNSEQNTTQHNTTQKMREACGPRSSTQETCPSRPWSLSSQGRHFPLWTHWVHTGCEVDWTVEPHGVVEKEEVPEPCWRFWTLGFWEIPKCLGFANQVKFGGLDSFLHPPRTLSPKVRRRKVLCLQFAEFRTQLARQLAGWRQGIRWLGHQRWRIWFYYPPSTKLPNHRSTSMWGLYWGRQWMSGGSAKALEGPSLVVCRWTVLV